MYSLQSGKGTKNSPINVSHDRSWLAIMEPGRKEYAVRGGVDMCLLLGLLFGSNSSKSTEKNKERERRYRREELEEEYDEIDGIEDADY